MSSAKRKARSRTGFWDWVIKFGPIIISLVALVVAMMSNYSSQKSNDLALAANNLSHEANNLSLSANALAQEANSLAALSLNVSERYNEIATRPFIEIDLNGHAGNCGESTIYNITLVNKGHLPAKITRIDNLPNSSLYDSCHRAFIILGGDTEKLCDIEVSENEIHNFDLSVHYADVELSRNQTYTSQKTISPSQVPGYISVTC
jgi:hypothetical protein